MLGSCDLGASGILAKGSACPCHTPKTVTITAKQAGERMPQGLEESQVRLTSEAPPERIKLPKIISADETKYSPHDEPGNALFPHMRVAECMPSSWKRPPPS